MAILHRVYRPSCHFAVWIGDAVQSPSAIKQRTQAANRQESCWCSHIGGLSNLYCLLVNFSASNWQLPPAMKRPPWKLLVSCLAWCRKLCRAVSNTAEDQLRLYLAQPTILLSDLPTALCGDNTRHKMLPQFARHTSLNWASGCSMQQVSCAWVKFEWLQWTELNRPPKSREWLD